MEARYLEECWYNSVAFIVPLKMHICVGPLLLIPAYTCRMFWSNRNNDIHMCMYRIYAAVDNNVPINCTRT